ncbi:transcriptional repressor [Palleronia sediminis]|uniref:Ferric uptake regulation protein n=1 Tax=Palleronia sediminis TaxID=2547833 RepID=A0A4R6A9Z1_9RHOB|nr:Fur family transcriptional regulator [Palleronia sediminis]TDL79524.1 transcriptional repressor [Palleronia sediminis]
MSDSILDRLAAAGLRQTHQRRVIARVLDAADDHPDAEELHKRAQKVEPSLSLATVYRTLRLFEDSGLLESHAFGDGRTRWEDAERQHHDHLIDIETGDVIEFVDPEIEKLQEKIARRLGYDLVGHRLELRGKRRR